jgi:hypothetical protein
MRHLQLELFDGATDGSSAKLVRSRDIGSIEGMAGLISDDEGNWTLLLAIPAILHSRLSASVVGHHHRVRPASCRLAGIQFKSLSASDGFHCEVACTGTRYIHTLYFPSRSPGRNLEWKSQPRRTSEHVAGRIWFD